MKERIAKASLGCCRLKRRMRTLIRNVRPIATDPDLFLKTCDAACDDVASTLRTVCGLAAASKQG